MANQQLFNTLLAAPIATAKNQAQALAYQFSPKHQLVQLAMTGCLNNCFYANAEAQLTDVLQLTQQLDGEFIAKTAIYCRERAAMKDMPALLTAILAAQGSPYLASVFERVINNGKMLRNFVQIMRSGVTGRKSLGTRPKKQVQAWLNRATEAQLLQASVGNAPSLADVVKMVHPKPNEPWREAWFAWLIGKEVNLGQLPAQTQALLAYRADSTRPLPQVPFQLLSDQPLTATAWAELAESMGWQALRMNLNTLVRHGAFAVPGLSERVAQRLSDPQAVAKAKVYPYQLLAAYQMAADELPVVVREALQIALDCALLNVPQLAGQIVVCPDVSGSMQSPVTGYRSGATTKVRCIDVAALVAAALLRRNPASTRVLPFECEVVKVRLNGRDSVLTNAAKLAAIGGGGTSCSAPLKLLADERAKVDCVILVSDNESWLDNRRHGATETRVQWQRIKQQNPHARLVCIDLQPSATTQAADAVDILNVGGFGDSVFDLLAQFAAGRFGAQHWLDEVEAQLI